MRLRILGAFGLVLVGCGTGSAAAPMVPGDAAAGDATAADALPGDSAGSIVEAGGADSPGADADAGPPSDAGADWTFVRPVCGGGADSGAGCPGAKTAAFSNPRVVGADGGAPSPGGGGTVSVVLSAPTMSLSYPCVGFAADNAGVSFGLGDAGGAGGSVNPAFIGSYALLMGMSITASMQVHFAASIPHGTVIRFAAWADSLNSGCADGAKVEWDVTLP